MTSPDLSMLAACDDRFDLAAPPRPRGWPARVTLAALALVAGLSAACRKNEPTRQAATETTTQRLDDEDTSYRYPAAPRIVAVGDLHGDLRSTRMALRLAGAIDAQDRWVGGSTVVVQTGDQLDRGDDEPEILDLLDRLRDEAKAAGGALFALNGNHEIMNVQGDFRYATPDGLHDFQGVQPDGPRREEILHLSPVLRGRASAFWPGGSVAKRLAQHPVVIQIGDNVFVHGGILERHVRYGLGRINKEVGRWMESGIGQAAPAIIGGETGPAWMRDYSEGQPPGPWCGELSRVLSRLSAKRMIVGHTVQKQGINSACGAKVWRIDVGLSHGYGGKPSVLEIVGDQTRVLEASAAP